MDLSTCHRRTGGGVRNPAAQVYPAAALEDEIASSASAVYVALVASAREYRHPNPWASLSGKIRIQKRADLRTQRDIFAECMTVLDHDRLGGGSSPVDNNPGVGIYSRGVPLRLRGRYGCGSIR